jgi:hypothetical protein
MTENDLNDPKALPFSPALVVHGFDQFCANLVRKISRRPTQAQATCEFMANL